MEKLTLTRKEAAAILGISTGTVTQWVKSGRLRAVKISKEVGEPDYATTICFLEVFL